jgi:3'-phosphoadenosine 5'-phosphosulfate sulfotransferase (PAPS reductase)/FAD synthetase
LKHVVQFSGGAGSWAAAKRVAERYGTDSMVLLFADVKDEHPDLYRFIDEAAANVGVPLTVISDGRTPRQVMSDERLIGNSRMDPCSKILKRELLDRWCRAHCDPDETARYIGIDWTEFDRLETFRNRVHPWKAYAPLCEKPYISKQDALMWLRKERIELPLLYRQGFPHNNCGGACIKAGKGQWAMLLKHDPDRYRAWEEWEETERARLGDHSILNELNGGTKRVLTLRNYRLRLEADPTYDQFELGGCGCAL